MGRQKGGDRRRSGQGWLSTLVGILVLTAGGFLIGLVVGVVSEEPATESGDEAPSTRASLDEELLIASDHEVRSGSERGSPPCGTDPSLRMGPAFAVVIARQPWRRQTSRPVPKTCW